MDAPTNRLVVRGLGRAHAEGVASVECELDRHQERRLPRSVEPAEENDRPRSPVLQTGTKFNIVHPPVGTEVAKRDAVEDHGSSEMVNVSSSL